MTFLYQIYYRKLEIFDQNTDGFLSWSEIEDYLRFWHHFGIFYQVKSELKYYYQNGSREDLIGPDNQLDLEEFQKWGIASIAKCVYRHPNPNGNEPNQATCKIRNDYIIYISLMFIYLFSIVA